MGDRPLYVNHGSIAGRNPKPVELRRSKQIRMSLTPGQYHDADLIATAWDVPIATALYAMVAHYLSDCRGLAAPELGDLGLQIAASCKILDSMGVHARTEESMKARRRRGNPVPSKHREEAKRRGLLAAQKAKNDEIAAVDE